MAKKKRIINKSAMTSAAQGFAGTLTGPGQSSAFMNFANEVIDNIDKLSKHVEKMNDGWSGD